MIRRALRAAALGAAAFVLAACATVPPAAVAPPEPAAATAVAAMPAWRATGRVAIRTPQDGWSASFDWTERDGRGEANVRGPFGAGAAQITRTDDSIRIVTGRGEPIDVPAPFDALEPALVERLGFPLPLDQLRYWLLGVPAPGRESAGTPGEFQQAGWAVRAADYAPADGAPAPLPRRLVLTREGTRIRVVVDRWDVPPP